MVIPHLNTKKRHSLLSGISSKNLSGPKNFDFSSPSLTQKSPKVPKISGPQEMGRPATPCKLGAKRVRSVRCRGGNMKYRALRLDAGNYAWGSVPCRAVMVRLVVMVHDG